MVVDCSFFLVLFYQLCLLIFAGLCCDHALFCTVLSAKSASELCILFAWFCQQLKAHLKFLCAVPDFDVN